MKNKNLYIKICEFGNDHREGFTLTELENIIKPNEFEKQIINDHITNAGFNSNKFIGDGSLQLNPRLISMFERIGTKKDDENGAENPSYILSSDTYFNYLDYLELQAAKKSSKTAIIIAIISISLTLIFSIYSILNPVSIEKHQFNKVIKAINSTKMDETKYSEILNIIKGIKINNNEIKKQLDLIPRIKN